MRGSVGRFIVWLGAFFFLGVSLTSAGATVPPGCAITSPAPGASGGGDFTITFDGEGTLSLTSIIELTTDGGVTFHPATAAATSPYPNPATGLATPFTGVSFIWDSLADGIGLPGTQSSDVRITVDDGSSSSSCSVTGLQISNGPSCTITSPAMGASGSGDFTITFDGSDAANSPLTSTFEYTTDGGATFALATAAGASPISNPDPNRATPFTGLSFIWDSFSDAVGLFGPQSSNFRVTVDNGVGAASNCSVTGVNVDNAPPPSDTATATATGTSTATATETATATATETGTATATATATATETSTATASATPEQNGAACAIPGDCQSLNCVDRVCCDTACDGPAQACNVPGSVGACTDIVAAAPTTSRGILLIAITILAAIAARARARAVQPNE